MMRMAPMRSRAAGPRFRAAPVRVDYDIAMV